MVKQEQNGQLVSDHVFKYKPCIRVQTMYYSQVCIYIQTIFIQRNVEMTALFIVGNKKKALSAKSFYF